MPFTPFHMGPGIAIKSVLGNYFSLTVFGFSQVVIDIEPLVRILRGDAMLHGVTHTYLGAFFLGMVSLLVGKIVCTWLLRLWNVFVGFGHSSWLRLSPNISWLAATIGAFLGVFSHVFLDSIMHSDMKPFLPFDTSNNLLYLMPIGWLHLWCLILGIAGLMIILVVGLWNKWTIEID